MSGIRLEHVTKRYGDTIAVDDLTLDVGDGEFLVLVGPSGCGKTTALRMVAGLEELSAGEIFVGGTAVGSLDPKDRDVAMVFQNYALYPHMNVADNIGFGLRMRGMGRTERRAKVEEAASILGLTGELDRKPGQLSGGQRQRVAMGRAIIREPQAFLMDEPLSNLDAKLRVQMRAEIARIQLRLGVTTLYVTHDQIEAMTMGHRVAVMRQGQLQQIATPREVYARPANLFVASFIGSPPMNFLIGRVENRDGQQQVRVGDALLPAPVSASADAVAVGFRPEHVFLADSEWSGPTLSGRVLLAEALGATTLLHVACSATPVRTEAVIEGLVDGKSEDEAQLLPEDQAVFLAQTAGDKDVAPDTSVELALDAQRAYFFDLESGEALSRSAAVSTTRV